MEIDSSYYPPPTILIPKMDLISPSIKEMYRVSF